MEKDVKAPFLETTATNGLGYNMPAMICVEVSKYDLLNDERLLIPVIKGGKFGMLNRKGEEVVAAEYDAILDECRAKLDYVRVCKNQYDNYGEVNKPRVYHTCCVNFFCSKTATLSYF